MIKPLRPEDIGTAKAAIMPDFVLLAVNDMLARKWSGNNAHFTQNEIMALVLQYAPDGTTREEVYANKWLDFEEIYQKEGWKVIYDKPGFNESYEANFTFRR